MSPDHSNAITDDIWDLILLINKNLIISGLEKLKAVTNNLQHLGTELITKKKKTQTKTNLLLNRIHYVFEV